MSHELYLWAAGRKIAVISYDALDDRWSLTYDEAWAADPQTFPLSPALPLIRPESGYTSSTLRRFIEHLLPEGRALDVAVAYNGVAKSNVFGLIRALGGETAGALRFTADAVDVEPVDKPAPREIPLQELDERIAKRESVPFTAWDGKVRMSVAGLQDKLLVYIDRPLSDGGRLFLVDGRRLASTHILKPDTGQERTPHLAVNEHFCMCLADKMGLPAAQVSLLRTPRPVLLVRRFDREVHAANNQVRVHRMHIIDACQAGDLPVSYKYERNLGSAPEVRDIREGMSFERLFR
ncbi:HipA domain-containing protein, partial [Azohydromonas lata]